MKEKKLFLEKLEDSEVLMNKKPTKYITITLVVIFILLLSLVISISLFKKDIIIEARASIQTEKPLINISSENSGKIDKIEVSENASVEKNNIIIKLKNEDIELNSKLLSSKLSSLKEKESVLKRLRLSLESMNNNLYSEDSQLYKDEYSNYLSNINSLNMEIEDEQLSTIKIDQYKKQKLEEISIKLQEVEDEIIAQINQT